MKDYANLDDFLNDKPAPVAKGTGTAPVKKENVSYASLDEFTSGGAPSGLPASEEPINIEPPITNNSFPEYDKAQKTEGKKSVGFWSKVGSLFKEAAVATYDEAIKPAVGAVMDFASEQRKKNAYATFETRQLMYRDSSDPLRFVKDEKTGKKRLTNNAIEAFRAAQTDEEKDALISQQDKEIPLVKALNSETGKSLTKAIAEGTSNVPLKVYARVQSMGDKTYQEAYDALKASAEDPNNPRWQRILYGLQNSGVQSAIGVILGLAASAASKNPSLGTATSGAYFSAISAEEERKKSATGDIEGMANIENIAIDTVGDTMLSGIAEAALKNFAKESAKATLRSYAAQATKGALVEGVTEPTQSILKFANDYTAAKTEEKKKDVSERFAQYMKSGAMLDEFLIGGLAGGIINTAASGAGQMVNYVSTVGGGVLEPDKLEALKDEFRKDVEDAIDSGDFGDAIDKIQKGGNLDDENTAKVIQDIAEDVIADNAIREPSRDSAAYNALVDDTIRLLSGGNSAGQVAIELEQLVGVSAEYAQNLVAEAVSRVNEGQQSLDEKITETLKNTSAIQKRLGITTDYEGIANKLKQAGLEEDVLDASARALVTAISRQGNAQEKQAAVDLLSNPANTVSREIYSQEIGQLPEDEAGSRKELERRINKSFAREYAEENVRMVMETAQAGYRVFTGYGSDANVYGVPSTFPQSFPEELRSRKLFDKVMPYIEEGVRPKETANNFKLARLYDEVQKLTAEYETQFEKEGVIDLTQTQDIRAEDIPFQVAHDTAYETSIVSREEAMGIVRSIFGENAPAVDFYEKIRTPRGLAAWGKYADGVISLVENPKADTVHHESVHAFLDLFVPFNERDTFLETAYNDAVERLGDKAVQSGVEDIKSRYGGKISDLRAKEIYSEEALADGFYEYVQGRNKKTALARFYEAVIRFLKSLKGDYSAQSLYEEMLSAKKKNLATRRRQDVAVNARYQEYAMSHRPTQGLQVNNIEKTGGDIEMPKGFVKELDTYFSQYGEYGIATKESIEAVRKLDGKSDDTLVTIYRASPSEEINSGDWITLSKKYAELHAASSGKKDVKVRTYKVPAKTVHFAGDDINEFGYFPEQAMFQEEKPDLSPYMREGQNEVYNTDDVVARERFDIPKLKKVSFGGSDRDVYDMGKYVLKVAKTYRGLIQNDYSSDYYAEGADLIPQTIEVGKNYIVKEKVAEPDKKTKEMVAKLKTLQMYEVANGRSQPKRDSVVKAVEIMEEYGYSGGDLINHEPLWGDVQAIRNWGTKNGKPIMLDEGTLYGDLVKSTLDTRGKNLSQPRFSEIYYQSGKAKKKYADTDLKTMYQMQGMPHVVRTEDATATLKLLAEKQEVFKNATPENSETITLDLGTKTVKVEKPAVVKMIANNRSYAEEYAVVVEVDGKDIVVFKSQNPSDSLKWAKANKGGEVMVPATATAHVMYDNETAHVVIDNEEGVQVVKGLTRERAPRDVFYNPSGLEISDNTRLVEMKRLDVQAELQKMFPTYYTLINGKVIAVHEVRSIPQAEPFIPKVDESKVTRSEKEGDQKEPVTPTEETEQKESAAFAKVKSRIAEQYQEDVTYTPARIVDQTAKAMELIKTNPEYAKAVALGFEQPPLDITDTAISIAVAEQARTDGDFLLQAQTEKARSLRQTRRGQEISMEKGRVNENSPEFFIRELLERRKYLATKAYKPILGKAKPFMELLDEEVTTKRRKSYKKLKSDLEIKAEELDTFLAEIAC